MLSTDYLNHSSDLKVWARKVNVLVKRKCGELTVDKMESRYAAMRSHKTTKD